MARSIENLTKNHCGPPTLGSRLSLREPKPETIKIGKWDTGRTAEGWAKIIGFYIIYYTLLAFLTWLIIVKMAAGRMPDTDVKNAKPMYQSRFHSPGMKIWPASETAAYDEKYADFKEFHESSEENKQGFGHGVYTSLSSSHASVASYKEAWDRFLAQQSESNEAKVACDSSNTQGANDDACQIYTDFDWITQSCGENFGFDQGEPCFAISVNRVMNWEPVPLDSNSNIEVLNVNNNATSISGDNENIFFHCDQFNMVDQTVATMFGDGEVQSRPDYDKNNRKAEIGNFEIEWVKPNTFSNGEAPKDAGIPNYFYPYKRYDNSDHKAAHPFVVMKVKAKDVSISVASNFKCNAYAKNTQYGRAQEDKDLLPNTYMYKWEINGKPMDAGYNNMVVQNEFVVHFHA